MKPGRNHEGVETLVRGERAEVSGSEGPNVATFEAVEPPALLTVSCPACGRERMTMAHDGAGVDRASRCDWCGTATRLDASSSVGPACDCCF